MTSFFFLFVATAAVLAAGKLGDAAPSTAEVFWHAVLPDSPLPDAILRLLRPDTSFVSKMEAGGAAQTRFPYDYSDYKESSPMTSGGAAQTRFPYDYSDYKESSPMTSGDLDDDDYASDSSKHVAATRVGEPSPFSYGYSGQDDKGRGATAGEAAIVRERDFDYDEYVGSRKLRGTTADEPFGYDYKAPDSSSPTASTTARTVGAATTTVFFHEEAVRVGERLPFYFPAAVKSALGFLPRRVADSIPFTTPALPGILALLGIASDSAEATSMRETLRMCEWPTLAGEAKFCGTSLEAMVEGAMAALGTLDVRAITSSLPRAGAPMQQYTIRAVLPIDGSSFVACHDQAYPYTVYRCHTTGPVRAYMVEMEGAAGAGAVTVATVCHTDTSRWNPEHVSFKLLGTKPGGVPVCHLMPYGHIIWAKNVKRSLE
ncbi:hypothetical protein GUJ93_ZPchr0010g8366 [Zizania palustris]|uniref:BURP domain-containing protein n=1 Tax=Zizania palustris TaxID=103762 RepID=A0A8J5WCG8_ZIZPA|nr:hypothetical protein GUJ93_ZPchr0010g8366 [Zizania palustris]